MNKLLLDKHIDFIATYGKAHDCYVISLKLHHLKN